MRHFVNLLAAAAMACVSTACFKPLDGPGMERTIFCELDTATSPESVVRAMGVGWNLGNNFDAHSNGVSCQTAWGNKPCSQATFDSVAAAGFRTVRIPITWLGHVGPAPDYKIDEAWMAQVDSAVSFAQNAKLNVIVNIHHDGADGHHWLKINAEPDSANAAIEARLAAMWRQIAMRFSDRDASLIFETMNEIHDGGWGWGANRTDGGAQYARLNRWQQICVDAIRSAGGRNATRWIAVQGYVTNPDMTIEHLAMPADSAKRTMVSVHFYDPFEYTLSDKFSEWGEFADTAKCEKWGGEADMRAKFAKLKARFVDAGIPVYIGEVGCVRRSTKRAELFRAYYLEYLCKAANECLLAPIFWDNGYAGSGQEQSGLFDHGNGAALNDGKEIAAVMVRAMMCDDASYTLSSITEDYRTRLDGLED